MLPWVRRRGRLPKKGAVRFCKRGSAYLIGEKFIYKRNHYSNSERKRKELIPALAINDKLPEEKNAPLDAIRKKKTDREGLVSKRGSIGGKSKKRDEKEALQP